MFFHVLGPLEVHGGDGSVICIRQRKPRVLLSLLLLRSGAWVSVDRISAALWEDSSPRSAFGNIKTYVSQLRRVLPASSSSRRIESRPGEYRITVAQDELDLMCFERFARLGKEALRQGDDALAAEYLQAALELWRGDPFDELPSEIARAESVGLQERHWAVWEDLVDARIALGRHDAVVPVLRSLTVEHPTRERLWGQLLTALYRSGRRAEALSAYQVVYRLLNAELGIDPGVELQRLHQQILMADLALDAPYQGGGSQASAVVRGVDRH